jgi:hypothetical protein
MQFGKVYERVWQYRRSLRSLRNVLSWTHLHREGGDVALWMQLGGVAELHVRLRRVGFVRQHDGYVRHEVTSSIHEPGS